MNSIEIILESQKYIEEHLENKLIVSDIAEVFGYSVYYFSRMFSKYVGMSVMEYAKRRRLMRAAEDILGGMKIIDAAIKYSYDSHSAFTKAFKKEFDFPPSLLHVIQIQMNDINGGYYMSRLFIRQIDEHGSKEYLYGILMECMKENQIKCDIANIQKTYVFSDKVYEGIQRYSGDEYITHPLHVAILLAEIEAGEKEIIAGLMCDIFKKTRIEKKVIEERFSSDIADIVKGVCEFDEHNSLVQDDILLVKLAERLHNMRTLKYMDKNQWKVKAKETVTFYMPLARKLGNNALTEELNKLAIEFA